MFSDKTELFKVLFAIYDLTKAYSIQPVYIPHILSHLKFDESKDTDVRNLTLYLKNEFLVEYKYLGPGITITNAGINEIEEAVIHPNAPTYHFPVNIIKNIEVEISLRDFMNNVRKARRDFLQKLYTITKGQQTQGVYLAEFAKEIGLDNFMLDRVYWYLLDQGLIDTPFIGAVSISHAGIIEVEQELTSSQSSDSQLWESHYPDVTLVGEVVERIEHLNEIARPKLGFDIFNTRAKLFIDLRKSLTQLTIDTRDEHAFVVMLLSIGSILNDIKSNEIKQVLTNYQKKVLST